jgi:hypothetical protein
MTPPRTAQQLKKQKLKERSQSIALLQLQLLSQLQHKHAELGESTGFRVL